MAFVTDKEELKPGLIIFRRSDVQHRNWYCRVKLPKADRYKTVSLKTSDINAARTLAWDQDGEVRYAIKIGHPIFNRPFREVAKEYLAVQETRAKRGEITKARVAAVKSINAGALEDYIGSTQVHLVGDELWGGYPNWRRENGAGVNERSGSRLVSRELAVRLVAQQHANRHKARIGRGLLRPKAIAPADFEIAVQRKMASPVPYVSDATIRYEMAIFGAVMSHAVKKRYVPASQRFDERPKLKTMRRDEFNLEEYRQLYTYARDTWIDEPSKGKGRMNTISLWYRTVAYNFVLIMCNTGMRPPEAKNLRWRDIALAKDRDGREIVVLSVQGKGKSRKLVAPDSVAKYLDRIRAISKATAPGDSVFTTIDGKSAKSLYESLIIDLLTKAGLRTGACGTERTTYSFRHTYATFRLSEGVDVYFLAEQMGTSVKMIEDHYGHVNTIKHADRVLQGIGGWDPVDAEKDGAKGEAKAKAAKAAETRDKAARPVTPNSAGQRNRRS
jgi:integrase